MKRAVVVSDERSATLCAHNREASGAEGGRWRLEEVARLDNRHEDEHEHGRPDLLGRGAPTGPQHLMSEPHTREEEARRFAREVAAWLKEQRQVCGLDRVAVFAPPRFLGMLRDEHEEQGPFELLQGEFTGLPLRELEGHPAVIAALGAAATRG